MEAINGPSTGRCGVPERSNRTETVTKQSHTAKATVVIQNQLGLHARPAMTFVDTASGFACDVRVRKGSQSVDGKSIMQMMILAATQGTQLQIEAEGADAHEAVDTLLTLVKSKFGED